MSAHYLFDDAAAVAVSRKGMQIKFDAFKEWIDAINGPLPAEPVTLVHVPRVACESRRPAPKEIPCWSLV